MQSQLHVERNSLHNSKRQLLDIPEPAGQKLPNELVLLSMRFAPPFDELPCVHAAFPRLSHSSNRLSIQYPQLLGVATIPCALFDKLSKSEKPPSLDRVRVLGWLLQTS